MRIVAMFVLVLLGCASKNEPEPRSPAVSTAGPAAAPVEDVAKPPAVESAAKQPAASDRGGGTATGFDTMTPDQACDKVIAIMRDLNKAVGDAGDDCDRVGDSMQNWVADNRAFIDWGREHDKDATKKQQFDDVCKPKMEGAMKDMSAMMGAMMKCAGNAKVKAAADSMDD